MPKSGNLPSTKDISHADASIFMMSITLFIVISNMKVIFTNFIKSCMNTKDRDHQKDVSMKTIQNNKQIKKIKLNCNQLSMFIILSGIAKVDTALQKENNTG